MKAKEDFITFSDSQWHFLVVLLALRGPVHIDIATTLAPLAPGELLGVLRSGQSSGVLKQTNSDMFAFDADANPKVTTLLRERDTQAFRRSLLEIIEERDLAWRIPTEAHVLLLSAAGKTYEAAYLAYEQARTAISKEQFDIALTHTHTAIDLLATNNDSAESDRLYIATAKTLADLQFRAGMGQDDVIEHLHNARTRSAKIGDKRSMAMIGLQLGRFYFLNERLHDTLSSLQSSLAEVQKIGDADILERAAEFHGLYAYLQGQYREALEQFERAVSLPDEHCGPFIPLYLGFSAACLGQFHRAIGVIDTYRRKCLKNKQHTLAIHAQVVLAYVLTMMGRDQEAITHMPDVPNTNSTTYLIWKVLRAYHAFSAGLIKEAHAHLDEVMSFWAQKGLTIRQYPTPPLLEMLDEFDRLGFTPTPGFVFQDELQRILKGPNVHLRGVALRLQARRITAAPDKHSLLLESEACLIASGDPVETSKTRIELARLHLTRGEHAEALAHTMKAREGLAGLGERFFPDDLQHLLQEDSDRYHAKPVNNEAIAGMLDMITDLIPSPDVHDLLGQVVLTASGYVRAERSGLFRFDEKRPLLEAARNLSEDEVFGENFRSNLSLIFQAHSRNETICRPLAGNEETFCRVLCLPLENRVIYFDNSYDKHAFDFLDTVILRHLNRILSTAIQKVTEYSRVIKERNQLLISEHSLSIEKPTDRFFLTGNPRMKDLLAQLDRAATTDTTILITGETGVGKELVAQRVHAMSPRKKTPLVTVELSSIPETLVESELFGHEKGAFTGADRQRHGRFELAHKGTLFIDEIGEIPATLQVKLLRTLQEKSFMRLGGSRTISSDFRLVAATNRDLAQEVKAGRFRQDLYYRLHVIHFQIPPLRERPEDILLLAQHFLNLYSGKYNRSGMSLSSEDKACLTNYSWPGNVRELSGVIERSVLLAGEGPINLLLPSGVQTSANQLFADTPTLDEVQRRYINRILELTAGKIGGKDGAAQILGMKRTSLNARMKKLGMR